MMGAYRSKQTWLKANSDTCSSAFHNNLRPQLTLRLHKYLAVRPIMSLQHVSSYKAIRNAFKSGQNALKEFFRHF